MSRLPLQVGVVSDYDLLALDKLGTVKNDKQLFPAADETWQVGATAAAEISCLGDCVQAVSMQRTWQSGCQPAAALKQACMAVAAVASSLLYCAVPCACKHIVPFKGNPVLLKWQYGGHPYAVRSTCVCRTRSRAQRFLTLAVGLCMLHCIAGIQGGQKAVGKELRQEVSTG
jgi:hypothetical protein